MLLGPAALLLATMVQPSPPPPVGPPAQARIDAAPVVLDAGAQARRRVGALVFRRGWNLNSPDPRFGGISAMHVEDGKVTALSDAGVLLHFELPGDGTSRLLQVQPLPGTAEEKRDRDTEAIAVHGDEAWVAFERLNAVARFRRGDWRLVAAAYPHAMREWRGNSGPEALVRLSDGRFLIFSEGRDDAGPFSDVLLFEGDPAESRTRATLLRYRRIPGYRVTDAALLPDGRLLVLNRRFHIFEGVAARLVIVDLPRLEPGATLEGTEIAELRAPLIVDNMEALAVTREAGRTIVRIASDDNFMAIQRSLLLEFEFTSE